MAAIQYAELWHLLRLHWQKLVSIDRSVMGQTSYSKSTNLGWSLHTCRGIWRPIIICTNGLMFQPCTSFLLVNRHYSTLRQVLNCCQSASCMSAPDFGSSSVGSMPCNESNNQEVMGLLLQLHQLSTMMSIYLLQML